MKFAIRPLICRFLVSSLITMSCQTTRAGMIGAEQVAAPPDADRTALMHFINRTEVASELQARGIAPQDAIERIAAMTDSEVESLKGRIDALPAGAFSGGADFLIPFVAVLALLVALLVRAFSGKWPASP